MRSLTSVRPDEGGFMFYTSFIKVFVRAASAPRPLLRASMALPSHVRNHLAVGVTVCAARAYFRDATPPERGARGFARSHLRRAGMMAARAVLRVVHVGNALTPGGYAILAIAVIAVALVAVICASPLGNEPEPVSMLISWLS
jgi:hypothetical protein